MSTTAIARNICHPLPALLTKLILLLVGLLVFNNSTQGQVDRRGQRVRPFIVEEPPRSAEEQVKLFHLPDGFRIELVASEPAIINPINMNFDAAGRLYVSQSVEYPFPALDQPGRDTIVRLSDGNRDGRFDEIGTYARDLHIPIGITPVAHGAVIYSVPKLFSIRDLDGDGRAEDREVLFGDFGFTDTHGMISSLTRWIDGWVYGCHGFVNTSTMVGKDGSRITMVSGNTYRFRPDGTAVEHYSFGQVNPFGLTIDRWGNVFTSDCHSRPATLLLRGAHYPRSPGDGLGFGPELMQHSHGSTGIAGIVRYSATQFPVAYHGSLFIGNPVTGRVNRDRLERHGATYRAVEQPDFITCDDPWFRPVDLQLGMDGCLYIADMYNCIIGHYEVPLDHPRRDRLHGRIWRVSYEDSKAPDRALVAPPDLTRASPAELVRFLSSDNLVIRTQATHQLVDRVENAAAPLVRSLTEGQSTASQRAHGLWTLKRLNVLRAEDWQLRLDDSEALVRLHAVAVLADHPAWDDTKREAVIRKLADPHGLVRRAAAEAIGMHPRFESVDPLLQSLIHADPADTFMVQTTRIALRNTLKSLSPFPRLERKYSGNAKCLRHLADVSIGIPSPEAAEFLWGRVQRGEIDSSRTAAAVHHVVRYIDEDKLPDLPSLATSFHARGVTTQIDMALAVSEGAQERGLDLPLAIRQWNVRLVRPLLTSQVDEERRRGIELCGQMRLHELSHVLMSLCTADTRFPAERLAAIQALTQASPERVVPLMFQIATNTRDQPILRQLAAEQLGARKDPSIRGRVLELLPNAPLLVAVGLARGLASDRPGTTALLDLVDQGKVSPRVLQDNRLQRLLPMTGGPAEAARMMSLVQNLPSLDQTLQRTITHHRNEFQGSEADAVKGAEVFRKNCSVCHRLENQGEKVGPELDGIGQRGADRLLEDILDPNRTVDKNFRATVVVTQTGRVLTGLATGEEGQVLLLTDQAGKAQRINLAEIDDRWLTDGSAMPSNMYEVLKPAELYDLLAFLLTKTAGTPALDKRAN